MQEIVRIAKESFGSGVLSAEQRVASEAATPSDSMAVIRFG
jgi:hypothetical protein